MSETAKKPTVKKTTVAKTTANASAKPAAAPKAVKPAAAKSAARKAAPAAGPQLVPAPTHEQIAQRAYEIWASRGHRHGDHAHDWWLAEQELKRA
jgi:hypothetical protein